MHIKICVAFAQARGKLRQKKRYYLGQLDVND